MSELFFRHYAYQRVLAHAYFTNLTFRFTILADSSRALSIIVQIVFQLLPFFWHKLPEEEEDDEQKVEESRWRKKKFIFRTLRVYFGNPHVTICSCNS